MLPSGNNVTTFRNVSISTNKVIGEIVFPVISENKMNNLQERLPIPFININYDLK